MVLQYSSVVLVAVLDEDVSQSQS